jgi:nucleotide-binding universal stress UspA family protein
MVNMKNILYPTDFSEHSLVALPMALDLAERYGATLHCLHALDLGHEFFLASGYIAPFPIDEASVRSSVEEHLERFVQEHIQKAGRPLRQAVVLGKPFVEIIRYCQEEKIDLIVLGTHGHSALASILLGSVAEKVVRKAPCAVLTIRAHDQDFVMP